MGKFLKASPLIGWSKHLRSLRGKGKVVFVEGPQGVGKSALLAQAALERISDGGQTAHAVFGASVDSALQWYDDIAGELEAQGFIKTETNEKSLNEAIAKNRIVLAFKQSPLSLAMLLNSISALKSNVFPHLSVVFIDGFVWNDENAAGLLALKEYAMQTGIDFWTAAEGGAFLNSDSAKQALTALARISPAGDSVSLSVNGKTEQKAKIDPRTFLLA